MTELKSVINTSNPEEKYELVKSMFFIGKTPHYQEDFNNATFIIIASVKDTFSSTIYSQDTDSQEVTLLGDVRNGKISGYFKRIEEISNN